MEPFEEVLLAARRRPAPTPEGLGDVVRRARRRRTLVGGVAATAVAVTAGAVVATALPSGGAVVAPGATVTAPAPATPSLVVGGAIGWNTVEAGFEDRVLVIGFAAGSPYPDDPCYQGVRARAAETATTVTVTVELVTTEHRSETRRCLLPRHHRYEVVPLAAPLGDRTVVDGSSGAVRTVRR